MPSVTRVVAGCNGLTLVPLRTSARRPALVVTNPQSTTIAPMAIRTSGSRAAIQPMGIIHCSNPAMSSVKIGITGGNTTISGWSGSISVMRNSFAFAWSDAARRQGDKVKANCLHRRHIAGFASPSRGDNFLHEIRGNGVMAPKLSGKRETFRHGNLPEALVDAAMSRLEADGVEAISLRELA